MNKEKKILPSGWKEVRLGDCLSIKSGYSPSRYKLSEIGKHPFVKVEDMNNCEIFQKKSRFYTNATDNTLINEKSIIFPKRGAAILNNKIRVCKSNMYVDTNIMSISSNDKLYYKYAYYKLIQEKLYKIADTSSIPQINNKHIEPYKILLPPIEEQKGIAGVLTTWDEMIELVSKKIELLNLRKKSLMQKLLTPKPHWIEKKLGDLVNEKTINIEKGKALSSHSLIKGNVPVIAGGKTSPYNHNKETHNMNVITVSASGAYAGYIAFHDYPIWASDCNVVYAKNGETLFYYYFLKYNQSKIYSLQSGGAQPHIYSNDIKSLKIYLPSIKEQEEIADILSTADSEITLWKQKLDNLKLQKKSLMQKLLTGEWRI